MAAPPLDSELPWHVSELEWYAKSEAHWNDAPDVLGGEDGVNQVDTQHSFHFLDKLLGQSKENSKRAVAGHETANQPMSFKGGCALECGAGIGRVSEAVLLPLYEKVHLVELSEKLLDVARSNLLQYKERVEFTKASLRDYVPEKKRYDLVWIQWCLGHLTDKSVVKLLKCCKQSLRDGGFLVVKENNASPSECECGAGSYTLDEENAAVIRSDAHHRYLFRASGFRVALAEKQRDFPSDLYPVRMYHLVPSGN